MNMRAWTQDTRRIITVAPDGPVIADAGDIVVVTVYKRDEAPRWLVDEPKQAVTK